MNDTATVRLGQVWALDGDLALIITVEGGSAYVKDVTGSTIGMLRYVPVRELRTDWTYHSENARLTCVDHRAAMDASKFLTDKGLRDVLVDGNVVSAPLTVMSVMQFADDAMANGWAHDADCARMIGDLG